MSVGALCFGGERGEGGIWDGVGIHGEERKNGEEASNWLCVREREREREEEILLQFSAWMHTNEEKQN